MMAISKQGRLDIVFPIGLIAMFLATVLLVDRYPCPWIKDSGPWRHACHGVEVSTVLYRGNGERKTYVGRIDAINWVKSGMGIYGVVKLRSHAPRKLDIQTLHDIKKGPYWVRHDKEVRPTG